MPHSKPKGRPKRACTRCTESRSRCFPVSQDNPACQLCNKHGFACDRSDVLGQLDRPNTNNTASASVNASVALSFPRKGPEVAPENADTISGFDDNEQRHEDATSVSTTPTAFEQGMEGLTPFATPRNYKGPVHQSENRNNKCALQGMVHQIEICLVWRELVRIVAEQQDALGQKLGTSRRIRETNLSLHQFLQVNHESAESLFRKCNEVVMRKTNIGPHKSAHVHRIDSLMQKFKEGTSISAQRRHVSEGMISLEIDNSQIMYGLSAKDGQSSLMPVWTSLTTRQAGLGTILGTNDTKRLIEYYREMAMKLKYVSEEHIRKMIAVESNADRCLLGLVQMPPQFPAPSLAYLCGDRNVVIEMCRQYNPDLYEQDVFGRTILHHIVRCNDIEMVELISQFVPSLIKSNLPDAARLTPVGIAAMLPNDRIFSLLVTGGAPIIGYELDAFTVLGLAAQSNNIDALPGIIPHFRSIQRPPAWFSWVDTIRIAIEAGHQECARILLKELNIYGHQFDGNRLLKLRQKAHQKGFEQVCQEINRINTCIGFPHSPQIMPLSRMATTTTAALTSPQTHLALEYPDMNYSNSPMPNHNLPQNWMEDMLTTTNFHEASRTGDRLNPSAPDFQPRWQLSRTHTAQPLHNFKSPVRPPFLSDVDVDHSPTLLDISRAPVMPRHPPGELIGPYGPTSLQIVCSPSKSQSMPSMQVDNTSFTSQIFLQDQYPNF